LVVVAGLSGLSGSGVWVCAAQAEAIASRTAKAARDNSRIARKENIAQQFRRRG
jgi:hypothetical protein